MRSRGLKVFARRRLISDRGLLMPSWRVEGNDVTLAQFDVLGEDGGPGFVRHTGLAAEEGQHSRHDVDVFDMGPPLRTPGQMRADAQGTARLTDDEERKIWDFIDRHASEHAATRTLSDLALLKHAAAIYCIYPHTTPYLEEDGKYARDRFSCVGFVFEAYKRAGIVLLDGTTVPRVSLEKLKQSYPGFFASMLDNPGFRESMGLRDAEEWPVMLCGYLFHALNRSPEEIRGKPYVAREGDEFFT